MTVSSTLSVMLIVFAAVHILEEALKDFRRFFNTQWFAGTEDCPVSRRKGRLVDQVGLFALLAALAVAGNRFDSRWMLVAVGLISADVVQHFIFSIRKGALTPGVQTSVLYLLYVGYFFWDQGVRSILDIRAAAALGGGAAFIAANYLYAWWRMYRGRCGGNPLKERF